MRLTSCPACQRHLRAQEATCPFCGQLATPKPARPLQQLVLGGALMASTLTGCPVTTPAYGISPPSFPPNANVQMPVRENLNFVSTLPTEIIQPGAIAVGPAGDIYCISKGNQIFKGNTLLAKLDGISFGLTVDSKGIVYATDNLSNVIVRIATDGTSTHLPGTAPHAMHGIAIDSQGNMFIAEADNNRISKVAPDGTISLFAGDASSAAQAKGGPPPANQGGYVDGQGSQARFNYPTGLAIDAHDVLYVADARNARIRKITPDGNVTTLAGSGTEDDASGQSIHTFADGPGTSARFFYPQGLAVNLDGYVYVADTYNERIRKIAPDGSVTTVAGGGPMCPESTSEGAAPFDAATCFVDGAGADARFYSPSGVALDASGLLYVADQYNDRIRMIK